MNLPSDSRVWIYQSNRILNPSERDKIQQYLNQFTVQWTSHSQALKANAMVVHDCFLVLMVDESQAGASGCSIDKSVHFMQQIGQEFELDLFDRMSFAFQKDQKIEVVPKDTFVALYTQGIIDDNTLVFNNLVKNKKEFETQWLVPLKDSWHKNFV